MGFNTKPIIDHCSQCDCGQKRLIVQKSKYLCQIKNQKKSTPLLNKKPMNFMSKKRKVIEKKYVQAKVDKVDLEGAHCSGCGTCERLSLSHLIPRSRRRDLIDEPKNHRIHCMDGDGIIGCHTKLEKRLFSQLQDGQLCLDLINELDQEYYNLIMMKQC